MTPFAKRRLLCGAATLGGLAGVSWEAARRRAALESPSTFTGWVLLAVLIALAAFHLRKKIPAPPLGTASAWMQAHIYLGLAALPLFLLHVPLRWPNGVFETALAALFALTWCSGVWGLYWTRTIPRRLAAAAEEVSFDLAPRLRREVRDQAAAAVLAGVRDSGDATLGEFYRARLQPYFESAPRRRDRWRPTPRLRKALLAELTDVGRYLSERERHVAEQLFALVRRRDAIDYHEALQLRLRAWIVVHLTLTWPLLMAAGCHVALVHAFAGTAVAAPEGLP